MILSVVIISYNVKFFLEQCLSSLKKAVEGSSMLGGLTEVIVVDNASTDGSLDFLRPLFPGYQFIQNKENLGFARANNQALLRCSGDFVLFLNPDTILAEDCLESCISFFRVWSDAGALGVRMVDGAGRFLKESKRGFPGPWSSFFKMSGLTKLFPHSKIFSSYYMGHMDEHKSHAVDILSGAFMMVKKAILDETGGFDERFFMYGEDIDLSYRIQKAGYLNYYFAGTTILHFKGESTGRDFRYVNLFYAAMILFLKKHTKGIVAPIRLLFLTLAVRLHQMGAYWSTLVPKKVASVKIRGSRILVQGDPLDQEKWRRRIAEENASITKNGNGIQEILFCEGPLLSWKKIIQEISDHPDGAIYYFHGLDTHAAVQSFSSRHRGRVIET
jgi:N-acetylglucosaminyl-diphospho-decaprenol L-rhamnosyltransferase